MKKTLQGMIEAREGVSHVLEKARAGRDLGEQPARQKADETGGVLGAVLADDLAGLLAERGREKARYRQRRILFGQVPQHAQLAVDGLGSRLEIDDLEDILAVIRGTEMKIAVPLAGQ